MNCNKISRLEYFRSAGQGGNDPRVALFKKKNLIDFLQRFTNEDHLAVHKHKHEMTLKFGPARTDSVIIAGMDL